MFCKSGILIFIFAENNYLGKTVYMPIPCWLKHLCSIRALVPVPFFLSLSGYFFGVQRPSEFTFLPGPLRPSQEGALHLHPINRAPEASVNRANPVRGAFLAFWINQGISASFSPLPSYCRLRTTRFWSIKGPQQTLKIKRLRYQPRSHKVI